MSKAAVVLFGVVALAGCGSAAAQPITASSVRACLRSHHAAVVKATDAIAAAAPAAFDARLGRGDTVTLAFHRSDADAKRAKRGYELMAAAFGLQANDLLSVRGNVSVAWNRSPTSVERGVVAGCLK